MRALKCLSLSSTLIDLVSAAGSDNVSCVVEFLAPSGVNVWDKLGETLCTLGE